MFNLVQDLIAHQLFPSFTIQFSGFFSVTFLDIDIKLLV